MDIFDKAGMSIVYQEVQLGFPKVSHCLLGSKPRLKKAGTVSSTRLCSEVAVINIFIKMLLLSFNQFNHHDACTSPESGGREDKFCVGEC